MTWPFRSVKDEDGRPEEVTRQTAWLLVRLFVASVSGDEVVIPSVSVSVSLSVSKGPRNRWRLFRNRTRTEPEPLLTNPNGSRGQYIHD